MYLGSQVVSFQPASVVCGGWASRKSAYPTDTNTE